MAAYAGRYGPEGMTFPTGKAAKNYPIAVQNMDGSPATLYHDSNMMVPAPNPKMTDGLGNFTFHAEPGSYRLLYGASLILTVMVNRHPLDSVSEDELAEELLPDVSYLTTYENAREP